MPFVLLLGAGALAGRPPNVVFVLADDWGYGDIGGYHTLLRQTADRPATPHLDQLAAEGTLLTVRARRRPSTVLWPFPPPADPARRTSTRLARSAPRAGRAG